MDSDSESDGSHISATPPSSPAKQPSRVTHPKQKQHPPPPPQRRHPPKQHKQKQHSSRDSSAVLSSLPLPIPVPIPIPIPTPIPVDTASTVLTLPAGSRSFSKSRYSFSNRLATIHQDEDDDNGNVKLEDPIKSETKRVNKKPSNLIGTAGSSSSSSLYMPLKRPKSNTEGNFVKLNLTGRGRWSKNKTTKRNYNAYTGKSKWRGSKRSKLQGGAAATTENVFESAVLQEMREAQVSAFVPDELLEEAVKQVRDTPSNANLLRLLKLTHGYDSFRDGQLEAIKMLLDLKSTMLVLPTGAGKSLCYQLPAMVFPGITLVVSPLLALMIDQLRQLPPMFPAAVLCSSQSPPEVADTLKSLQDGAIKVLFVSPERFLNEEFMSIVKSISVSLVVVDEAHCISEWSHNFRPSYMRLRQSILRNELKVGCILAMTATATTKTLKVIMSALDIPLSNLIKTAHVRTNLQLSVSLSGNNKMKELIQLIKSSPFSEVKSMIIYCKFQHDTDTISKLLCDNNISSKSYHSGLQAKDRSRTQALFCSNKIRVVVATVAFGMGLDKSDLGAVIHYSLPGSIEEYVQEIGRAGRDGRLSYCHLFFDDTIYFRLRSFAFSDGVDEYAVNKVLAQVFIGGTEAIGKIQSLIIESTSRKFDVKEEVFLTILTQLELGEAQYLSLLPQINVTCSLNFHKTPPLELAHKELLIAAILKRSETKQGTFVFDIPTVANISGLSARDILNELLDLKFAGEVTYELKDPAYCYTILNIPGDICTLAAQVTKWLSEVEHCKVKKLDTMLEAVTHAVKRCEKIEGCDSKQHTACLQRKILDYFSNENEYDSDNDISQTSHFLRADIKVFLQSNSQAKFTPRAVARIMHGIGSPAYPSATWSRAHFWGRYSHIDFKAVMEAAKAELMTIVGQQLT